MKVNTLIFGRVANVGITEIDNEFEYTGTRHALWSARAVTTSACPPAAAVNSGVWWFLPKNEASQKSAALYIFYMKSAALYIYSSVRMRGPTIPHYGSPDAAPLDATVRGSMPQS